MRTCCVRRPAFYRGSFIKPPVYTMRTVFKALGKGPCFPSTHPLLLRGALLMARSHGQAAAHGLQLRGNIYRPQTPGLTSATDLFIPYFKPSPGLDYVPFVKDRVSATRARGLKLGTVQRPLVPQILFNWSGIQKAYRYPNQVAAYFSAYNTWYAYLVGVCTC